MREPHVVGIVSVAMLSFTETGTPSNWPGVVSAQARTEQTYDIPAQDLAGALRAFGRASGKQLAFDESLRRRNPAWGIRRVEEVAAQAAANGLALAERVAMPANNLTLIFRKD